MAATIYAVAVGAALALLMLAIAVSDWRRFRVPDRLVALALVLRVVDLLVAGPGPRGEALLEASLRAATMAGLLWLFRVLYRRLRGRDGLGLGDVKLAAVAGAWVDWPLLPFVIEFAALFGLALALVSALRAGRGLRADTKLPFAVGFAAAIFVGWQIQRLCL
ncbi:MAG: prepilin peptidase [Pseudomonadota bacterium]|nr:prepilin peptidase [Pseudomonadota bacterium]